MLKKKKKKKKKKGESKVMNDLVFEVKNWLSNALLHKYKHEKVPFPLFIYGIKLRGYQRLK